MQRAPVFTAILSVLVSAGGATTAVAAAQRPRQVYDPPPPGLVVSTVNIDRNDSVRRRIYADYGAVFAARDGVVPPPTVIFTTLDEVETWQDGLDVRAERIGKFRIELQAPAMKALLAARDEARARGLDVTPRGADAARRGYEDTVRLWRSRVEPALKHWVANGRLTAAEAARVRALSPAAQVPEVLELEKRGIWFSTDFSKSILYSVAAPGTSQHLSLLALDVAEFDDANVRAVLARHGWYQTVVSDLPHFTYLGVEERALPSLGLKRVVSHDRPFWVPDPDRR